MKVIGTAGHIDHGKSTLVRRLTGIDPDRLEEEKRRGMTIDLGFAWLSLPSGADVSIVDVPGHERFVRNMLAGAGGVDVALLVIAADEGVMPQTREHLDILDLLEVRSGVVALTKVDLVDEEWLELVNDDVESLLAGTELSGSPIIAVSARSGQGLAELLEALDKAIGRGADKADVGRPYLPVDRVFTISGFGTVVTGTLHDGRLRAGQEIEILPAGGRARIRGLQMHNSQVEEAGPGARVAVNLAGVSTEEISRGDVVAPPGVLRATRRFDARLRVVADAPFPLHHDTEVSVHLGAAERTATISLLDADEIAPGSEGWAQVRLRGPVAAVRGQRFILRLPAPARTVAGGEVIDLAPRHRRSDPVAIGRLKSMLAGRPEDLVLASMTGRSSRTATEIAALADLSRSLATSTLASLEVEGKIIAIGDRHVRSEVAEELERTVLAAVEAYHREYPLRKGMPREQLRASVHRTPGEWPAMLDWLTREGVLRDDGGMVAAAGHGGGLEARRGDVERVLTVLRAEPFAPPAGNELLQTAGVETALVEAMRDGGAIVKVSEGLYFERHAYDELVRRIVSIIQAEGAVTVAGLRDRVGTSRKYSLALLEHLDSERITRRSGDARTLGSRAPACA